jgi:hypothetical protein
MERFAKKTHFQLVKMQKMNFRKHIGKQVTREFVYFGFQSCVWVQLFHKSAEYGLEIWLVQNEVFLGLALDLQKICT